MDSVSIAKHNTDATQREVHQATRHLAIRFTH